MDCSPAWAGAVSSRYSPGFRSSDSGRGLAAARSAAGPRREQPVASSSPLFPATITCRPLLRKKRWLRGAGLVGCSADVIGLYLNPPENAAVFSVDEKTAIQALDRTVPVLPMSPGRAERHGFEYYRHGTRSLIAALDTQTGEVRGKTLPRIRGGGVSPARARMDPAT